MGNSTIFEIADGFGLHIEQVIIPDRGKAFKVYKGVNPVFVGTEEAVQAFLETYDRNRPGLYEASMFDYKE